MDTKTGGLGELVPLAFEYGPFFFAVLLLGVLMWRARATYIKACTRHSPPAKPEELRTHKTVYFSMMIAGFAMVAASVVWFFMRPTTRVVRGMITNVESYASLQGSERVFFRPVLKPRREDPSLETREEHFVVLAQRDPAKDPVRIVYVKEAAPETELFLTLPSRQDGDELVFALVTDSMTGKVRLVATRPDAERVSQAGGFSLVGSLAAQAPQRPQVTQMAQHAQARNCPVRIELTKDTPPALAAIRDPCSLPGSKLVALRNLESTAPAAFDAIFSRVVDGEPGIITLYDLTRHSDAQVAAQARAVLQRGGSTGFITRGLRGTGQPKTLAELALFRIPVVDASAIVQRADRYYVRANWPQASTRTRDCLATMFSKSLIPERSVDQERALLGTGERYVYWHTKIWAISIFDAIHGCGATPTFARLGPRSKP